MPGSSEYNVSVLASIRGNVANSLRMMASEFGRTGDRALLLQRRLKDLEASKLLSVRKAQAASQIDRDALTLLNRRYAKLLATGDLERTQAERARLNAQIRAREQRSSIRRQEEQIRLQRLSNDLAEKRAAVLRAGAAARGERFMAGMRTMGGVGAITAATTFGVFELAKKGLPITQLQSQLRISGGLNSKQVQALSQRALALSQRLGVVDWGTELKMALQLYQTVRPALAARMLGPVSYAADLAKLMNRGGLVSSAGEIARTANILGATTSRQALSVSTDVSNILRSGGAGIGMAGLANWMTYTGGVMPGRTVAQRARQMESWALLAGRFGGLTGAFSGENLQHLVRSLTEPTARDIAPIEYLERYGLARNAQSRTFANITGALRRAEMANKGGVLNTLDLLVGRSPAVAMFHELSRISPVVLKQIGAAPRHNLSIHSMWLTQMSSASARFDQMGAHLKTLAEVMGVTMDPALKKFSIYVSNLTDSLTKFSTKHPAGLRLLAKDIGLMMEILIRSGTLLGKVAGPGLMGALKGVHSTLKFDRDFLKFVAHPVKGTESLAHQVRLSVARAGRSAIRGAESWAEREHILRITGPININVHGAGDPDAVGRAVVRHLKIGVMTNTKTRGATFHPAANGVPTS